MQKEGVKGGGRAATSNDDWFLSVIVPVYNVAPYLRQCVESIRQVAARINSRWPYKVMIEIILVDDGSTDGSGAICDELAAAPQPLPTAAIRVVHQDNKGVAAAPQPLPTAAIRVVHQDNKGVAAARNRGLDMARGRWIWFVDSDDWLDVKETLHLVRAAAGVDRRVRRVAADVDFVQFGHRRVTDEGAVIAEHRSSCKYGEHDERAGCILLGPMFWADDSDTFFLNHPLYNHWCAWYRRDIVERHGLRMTEGVRVGEDMEMLYAYEMYVRQPVGIDLVPYVYRQREQSALHAAGTWQQSVDDGLGIMSRWLERIRRDRIKPAPWLDYRLLAFAKRIVYSARFVEDIDLKSLQRALREQMTAYAAAGFRWPKNWRMRIAAVSLRTYFKLNRIYLRLRGLE